MRERGGLVLEVGCGSGLLTRYLLDAGHRVVATDASPAMLDLARETAGGADLRLLTLPDDPLPEADAIVGVGHVLNYLPDVAAIERGLAAIGRALRPGGVVAIDLCDLEWARERAGRRRGAGSARTGRSSPSSRFPPPTGSSARWRRSSARTTVVAARRRAPRQRADRDRSRAGATRGGGRRGDRARVVRGRGAARGPASGRRPPARLTRPGRAYRSAILASICWVTAHQPPRLARRSPKRWWDSPTGRSRVPRSTTAVAKIRLTFTSSLRTPAPAPT